MANRKNISSGSKWEDKVAYSRAVRVGSIVEVAGTTAVRNGKIVGVNEPAVQADCIFQKIQLALLEVGVSMKDVVRTRMYITNISQWEEIAAVHAEYFKDIKPTSTMVEISRLIHPDMLVEIEVTAIVTD